MNDNQPPDDAVELIRQFWERIEYFNSLISEQIIEAQSGERDATEILRSVDAAIQNLSASVVSTGRTFYYDCKLPYQPAHVFSKGYTCKLDSSHKFCHSHSLSKCVICGGDLK